MVAQTFHAVPNGRPSLREAYEVWAEHGTPVGNAPPQVHPPDRPDDVVRRRRHLRALRRPAAQGRRRTGARLRGGPGAPRAPARVRLLRPRARAAGGGPALASRGP